MYIRKLKIGHSLGDSSEITTFSYTTPK